MIGVQKWALPLSKGARARKKKGYRAHAPPTLEQVGNKAALLSTGRAPPQISPPPPGCWDAGGPPPPYRHPPPRRCPRPRAGHTSSPLAAVADRRERRYPAG